jgi:integrase
MGSPDSRLEPGGRVLRGRVFSLAAMASRSARSSLVVPSTRPASTSSSFSHRRKHDSAIPRSWAISAIGFSRRRASSTALRRNSGGLAAGIQDSSPRRFSPQIRCPGNRVRLPRYAPLFELLVHTGRRRGEALALRWADVDLDQGMLRVRGTLARIEGALVVTEPKTSKSNRFVPISAPAEHLLQDVQRAQAAERLHAGSAWRETGHVFTTQTGEPCDPRNALRAFKVAAARAGLPDAGLHTLRHPAASVMLTHGVPLKVVSDILGHSSIAITGDVYGHVSPDVSRDAVTTLGTVLSYLGSVMVVKMVVKPVRTGREAVPGLPETASDLHLLLSG